MRAFGNTVDTIKSGLTGPGVCGTPCSQSLSGKDGLYVKLGLVWRQFCC